eukprot:gene12327-12462_t
MDKVLLLAFVLVFGMIRPGMLQSCPQWGPGTTVGEGVTTGERATAPPNVFSELSAAEYEAVLTFLLSQKNLGLVNASKEASAPINYIHGIWYEMPAKSAVLAHLDKGAAKPPRKARALLVLGKAKPPVVREMLVTLTQGANGQPQASNLEAVAVHSSKWATAPYNQRPFGVMDQSGHGFSRRLLYIDPDGGFQYLNDDIQRAVYVWFSPDLGKGDGEYAHPLPLQILVAGKGSDLSKWAITKWWFNGKFFNSIEELFAAWNSDKDRMRSGFRLLQSSGGSDKLYSNFKPRPGNKRGAQQPVGPVAFMPYGRRFSITDGNQISWLGWELNVGYLPHYGPRYMDLSFKGERIAYEISFQEALASYGADDLSQANTVYIDSHWGIGASVRELVQGVDCPLTAAFMDAVTFYKGRLTLHKNAVCVFEQNPDTPALRHYSYSFDFYGAVPGGLLVVRMVSSIYNYDYFADLVLSIDGVVETRVVTSGYVQAAAFLPWYGQSFGYPMMNNISGTVHTHVLGWKVDLDIGGTVNSVNIHNLKLGTADDGAGGQIYINKYDAVIAETENDAAYVTSMTTPKLPVVINENVKNAFGTPRGYKVQLHKPLLNLEPAGYARSKALGFMKWNFAATQHKDNEQHSSSLYSQARLSNPSTSLTDYVNGENIRNQDIVVWVNSGLYHIPVSEDAPVTPTTGNLLGFALIPFNWAAENPATDMANMIQIETAPPTKVANAIQTEKSPSAIAIPVIKQAVNRCQPSFVDVKFLTNGWEKDSQ